MRTRALWTFGGFFFLAGLSALLVELGVVRFANPSREQYPVWGIDVSHHQGPVDWPAVAGDGIAFVYLKATEGGDHVDGRFAENWKGAGAAGLARGAYHFFTFCRPGKDQAANFLARLPTGAELPPAIDVEYGGNCKTAPDDDTVRQELAVLIDEVERATGTKPLLYLTREADAGLIGDHFPGPPRWLRDLYDPPTFGGEWLFWQFANRARIDGIEGPVDLNVYAGSEAEFTKLSSARPSP